jgi:16S rRNA (adenine1518-N6/adenine1519-N6)-dimethyltransferase
MYDLCKPSVIRALMEEAGIALKKSYGQNFLVNPMVPSDIADSCCDREDSMILEIGPGIGCLTNELALRFARVVAVEIDKGLIPVLSKTLAEHENVTVINEDVMKLDLASVVAKYSEGRPVSVCANLPYYITTPILMRLLECGVPFRSITVMVQAEVASRLAAAPGSADWGAITAVLGYYGTVTKLFSVSAGNFMPPPKVNSAVIRIDLFEEKPIKPKNEKLFFGLIHAAFEQRRKTLVNAILAKYSNFEKSAVLRAIEALGYPETVRGEKLSTEDFGKLADLLSE